MKVIYILGNGHSGSTLLDIILGSGNKNISIGELSQTYYHYYNIPYGIWTKNNDNIKKFKKEINRCVCGSSVKQCNFWSKVLKNVKVDNTLSAKSTFGEKLKIFFGILFGKYFAPKDLSEDKKIYENIANMGYKNIIDSSKVVRRLYYLKNTTDLDIKVIHLVRDGRGMINSYEKQGTFFLKGYLNWIVANITSKIFLKNFFTKEDILHISYDKFAQEPEKYLEKINDKFNLDIDIKNYVQNVNNKQKHHFAGNKKVFTKQFEGIKYDQSWKKRMPRWKQYLLTVLTYIPNKIWVYNKKI